MRDVIPADDASPRVPGISDRDGVFTKREVPLDLLSEPPLVPAGSPEGKQTIVQKRQGANRRLSLPQEVKATSKQSLDGLIDCLSPICPRRRSVDVAEEHEMDPIHDDYRIGKTLGKGSYARVKLGLHIKTQEKVAIKIIEKAGLSEKDNDIERLMREIVILKGLRHPSICQLYEVINTKDRIYLILEYLTGGELFDYIVALRRVKEKPAREFFRQIVSAMEFCHSQDIIHRDLKPENLLLDEKGRIKIIDFGFSNTFDRQELLDTFCGSPAYAAPEMIAGKAYSGAASDVWSLGVILYAVVCGYLPFDHENTSKMYAMIAKGEYKCPEYLSPGVKNLMAKMLQVDPEERLTMAQVRLDPWLNNGYDNPPEIISNEPRAVDDKIVDELVRLGYDRTILMKSLDVDECNPVTAAYNLLYDKKMRSHSCESAEEADADESSSRERSPVAHPRRNTVEGVPVIKLQSVDYSAVTQQDYDPSRGYTGQQGHSVQKRRSNHRRQSETGDVRVPKIHQKVGMMQPLDIVAEEIENVDTRSAEPLRRKMMVAVPTEQRAITPSASRGRTQSVDSPMAVGRGKKTLRMRLREWIGPNKKDADQTCANGLKIVKNGKMFNAETVTSLPPEAMMEKVIKVVEHRGAFYLRGREGNPWKLVCEEKAYFKGKHRDLKYEVQLCRLKDLPMNGVSFKRVQGNLWFYKHVCDEITGKLLL